MLHNLFSACFSHPILMSPLNFRRYRSEWCHYFIAISASLGAFALNLQQQKKKKWKTPLLSIGCLMCTIKCENVFFFRSFTAQCPMVFSFGKWKILRCPNYYYLFYHEQCEQWALLNATNRCDFFLYYCLAENLFRFTAAKSLNFLSEFSSEIFVCVRLNTTHKFSTVTEMPCVHRIKIKYSIRKM